MDDTAEINDILWLLGVTFFFGCIEPNVNVEDVHDEIANVLSDTKTNVQPQNTLSVKSFVKDKAIEIYAKKGLENMKKNLRNSEPFIVGSIDQERIKEDDIDVTFQLKNVKLYNLGTFKVKKFKSISEQNATEFSLEMPSLRAVGSYDINGTFKGKKVNGKGESEINITGVTVDNARIVMKETPEEIQIESIKMCYDFKDLEIKQSGLTVEGLPSDEVTKFLNDSGKKYLRDNKRKICDRVASELKNRVNAKMKGKNREELMEMMKGMGN